MAKKSGWWSIDFTVDPNQVDLDHIAECIKKGYTSGEIVEDDYDEKDED